jgi:glycerophosphoryl diester phosphodiesterase
VSSRVAVVGHSGSSEGGVEPASLDAYAAAIAVGADMVEVDARWTADDVALALHDPDVDGRPIAELRADAVRRLVPDAVDVADVLALAAAHSTPVMFDLKDIGRESEAVELCRRHLAVERFVVSTLDDVSVAAIRRQAPDVEVGLSLDVPGPAPLERARACDARFLSLNVTLGFVDAAHHAGYPVFVWTVDDESTLRRLLIDARVRGVITNRPGFAVGLRDEP